MLTENNKIKKNRKGKYVLLSVGFGGGSGVKCQGFKKIPDRLINSFLCLFRIHKYIITYIS